MYFFFFLLSREERIKSFQFLKIFNIAPFNYFITKFFCFLFEYFRFKILMIKKINNQSIKSDFSIFFFFVNLKEYIQRQLFFFYFLKEKLWPSCDQRIQRIFYRVIYIESVESEYVKEKMKKDNLLLFWNLRRIQSLRYTTVSDFSFLPFLYTYIYTSIYIFLSHPFPLSPRAFLHSFFLSGRSFHAPWPGHCSHIASASYILNTRYYPLLSVLSKENTLACLSTVYIPPSTQQTRVFLFFYTIFISKTEKRTRFFLLWPFCNGVSDNVYSFISQTKKIRNRERDQKIESASISSQYIFENKKINFTTRRFILSSFPNQTI